VENHYNLSIASLRVCSAQDFESKKKLKNEIKYEK
jgi:hypothetical protein